MGLHARVKTHRADGSGCDIDFMGALPRILHCGVKNAVKVFLLDLVRVDNYKLADAVTRQLLDQRAARSRAAHDPDAQPAQAVVGASTKGLCDALSEFGNGCPAGRRRPKRKIVADDIDRRKRVKPASFVHQPANHSAIAKHDGTAVRPAVRP